MKITYTNNMNQNTPASQSPLAIVVEVSDVKIKRQRGEVPWKKEKLHKPTNRERRGRQNKRLRKLLTPKNALMILNELQGVDVPEYIVHSQYTAEVVVNGMAYQGHGWTKALAKNSAAEQAIRDLVIARMAAEAIKSPLEGSVDANGDVEMKDTDDIKKEDNKGEKAADKKDTDLPMLHLASYALHKLFLEWQTAGFEIPLLACNKTATVSTDVESITYRERKPPKGAKPKRDLPTNAGTMHPAMLLSQMRPGCQYDDLGVQGNTHSNTTFTVGVTIDGQQFIGSARNKKEARRLAALQACITALGVHYEKDYSVDISEPRPITSVVNV